MNERETHDSLPGCMLRCSRARETCSGGANAKNLFQGKPSRDEILRVRSE